MVDMRLPTLELGAGTTRDPDIDRYNDVIYSEGLDYHCNALKVPEEDGAFSIITANQMIEHLSNADQHGLIAECHRLLAEDGMLLLWTPDLDWMNQALANGDISKDWYEKLHEGVGEGEYDRHRHLLTKDTLRGVLEVNGFRVGSLVEVGGSIECVAFKEGRGAG